MKHLKMTSEWVAQPPSEDVFCPRFCPWDFTVYWFIRWKNDPEELKWMRISISGM